jgi:hypothetical protein
MAEQVHVTGKPAEQGFLEPMEVEQGILPVGFDGLHAKLNASAKR